MGALDQVTEHSSSQVRNLIIAQINVLNIECILFQGLANHDQVVICDTISEHEFVISWQDDFKALILIIAILEVLHKGVMGLHLGLLTDLLVDLNHIHFVQFHVVHLLLVLTFLVLLLLVISIIVLLLLLVIHVLLHLLLLVNFYHLDCYV